MSDERVDIRDPDPQYTHRRVFIGGWTDALGARNSITLRSKFKI